MKTSHILTFIVLVLFTSLLCISFYFVYSGAVQNSYIEQVKVFSQQRKSEFKKAGFYLEESEDPNSIETLNRQHEWIQSNYRSNPLLLSHIYRNPKTNDVIFSNSKDTHFDPIKSEYLRQWSTGFYTESECKIFSIGNLAMVGVMTEIEDEVLTLGKLELLFDYNPVMDELAKLRMVLIVFAVSVVAILFIIFVVISVQKKKPRNKELKNSKQKSSVTMPEVVKRVEEQINTMGNEKTKENPERMERPERTEEKQTVTERRPITSSVSMGVNSVNRSQRRSPRIERDTTKNDEPKYRNLDVQQNNTNVKNNDRALGESEIKIKQETYNKLKDKESEFLKATEKDSKNYIHKVRL